MNTIPSNSKFKPKLLKYLLTLLIILTAVQFTNPITAYAVITNTKGYNGGAGGQGAQVGKLHWAGSTERTGLIFYLIKNSDNTLVTGEDIGEGGNEPLCIRVIRDSDKIKFNMTTDRKYDTHFGLIKTVIDGYREDMPYPVHWNDDTSAWSGNNEEVYKWLFTEETNGYKVWENLVRMGFSDNVLEILQKGDENGMSLYTLVVEPISAQAVYSTQTWGEEANTIQLSLFDKDFVPTPSAFKPVLGNGNRVVRTLTTGRAVAHYNNEYIKRYFGTTMATLCQNGGANSRWTNQAMPYCMTLAREQAKIKPITSTNPIVLGANEFYNNEVGYAMSMFTDEVKNVYIDTYDKINNPDKPAPAEEPSEENNTDGHTSIVKVYFDIVKDFTTNKVTRIFKSRHVTKNASSSIIISDEQDKNGGYELDYWFVNIGASTGEAYEDFTNITYALRYNDYQGNSPQILEVKELGREFSTGDATLVVVYSKTETRHPQSTATQPENFEIPESYISKQVYFSQANLLVDKYFTWTSTDHNLCGTHAVIGCKREEHEHTPWSSATSPGCYETVQLYECSGDIHYCNNYHQHTLASCKERIGYICTKCNAVGSTRKSVRENDKHISEKGCSEDTIVDNYGDYKYPKTISRCVQCNSIYEGKTPNSCSVCSGSTFIKSTHCAKLEHDCADFASDIGGGVICGKEEHAHDSWECFSTKVECTYSWIDKKVKFGIKNILQGSNPDIQATNPNASTSIVADESERLALQGSAINVAKLYQWKEYTRQSTDGEGRSFSFDYSTILLRGKDKLTLAQWKTENQTVINEINSLSSTQFNVGNTPTGDREGVDYYFDSFSAKFTNNSSEDDLTTTIKFGYPSGVSSSTLEWIQNIIPIRKFLKCSNNSKLYQFSTDTTFEIPTIKVKVNVFSDYTNQNPGTPIHGDTTISFYPYVRMYYDTPTLKSQSALVLGENQRHFQAHDGADITFTNGTGHLTLTTSQWYLAKMI